jgi:DNA polymerase-3 subunit epsilon
VLWPSPPWDSLTYWALDLETGGLDPRVDPIVAVGMVPVRDGAVRLGEAYATVVRPEGAGALAPSSIRIHHLMPGDLREAPSEADVIVEVERRLRDGVLLVHHAALDVAFLKQAYRRARRRFPAPPIVDTVALLVRAAKRARFVDPDAGEADPELNLTAARRKLGLPEYAQHDALTDAIAAAELFLVLRRKLGSKRLRDLR